MQRAAHWMQKLWSSPRFLKLLWARDQHSNQLLRLNLGLTGQRCIWWRANQRWCFGVSFEPGPAPWFPLSIKSRFGWRKWPFNNFDPEPCPSTSSDWQGPTPEVFLFPFLSAMIFCKCSSPKDSIISSYKHFSCDYLINRCDRANFGYQLITRNGPWQYRFLTACRSWSSIKPGANFYDLSWRDP